MKIQVIQHAPFEKLGVIKKWALEKKFELIIKQPFAGEILDEDFDFDMLIILGGPQSILQKEEYPYLEEEKNFIQKTAMRDKKILGICLGAQLISEAFGASSEKSPNKEIGVFPVHLNETGRGDPLFQNFPDSFDSFHWHNDMMGIPSGAEVLAESSGCPRQIVKFADDIYGLQCHFEMTRENVLELMENCGEEYSQAKGDWIQFPEDVFASDFETMNTRMHFLLDTFASLERLELR
ncbi:MAG: GMP synthase [Simkaniaceae bacterium]